MSANSSSPELSDFERESGEVLSFFISSLLSTVVSAAVDACCGAKCPQIVANCFLQLELLI